MKLNEIFNAISDFEYISIDRTNPYFVRYGFDIGDIEYEFTVVEQSLSSLEPTYFTIEFYPIVDGRGVFKGVDEPNEIPSQNKMIEILNYCIGAFEHFYENYVEMSEDPNVFLIQPSDPKLNRLYQTMLRRLEERYPHFEVVNYGLQLAITDGDLEDY